MTDAKKFDSDKPRLDLIPYPDVRILDLEVPIETMYEALQVWFHGRPFALRMPIPRQQLIGIATVLGFGAAKYGDRNWESGLAYSRVFAAAARHAEAWASGDLLDPESGLLHSWHFWCNVMFLVTFTARDRVDLDDRPAPHPEVRKQIESGRPKTPIDPNGIN